MANDANTVARALVAVLDGPEHEHELIAVELEFADGVALPRPGAIYRSEKQTFAAYPAYEVLVVHTGRVSDDTPLARVHDVDIYVTDVGDDEERLTDVIQRLILSIRRMFEREDRGGQRVLMPFVGTAPVLPSDEDYAPVARPRDGAGAGRPFVKTGAIRLAIMTIG